MSDERIWTAAVLVIGDEILSGRTQDKNVSQIATWLDVQGIRLREVRIVPDVEVEIVDALNALLARYDYVFTTGGIGPTHDDITVDAVAKALGVGVIVLPHARAILERSEEHTSELQSLMRSSYAVFCLKKKNKKHTRLP